MNQLHVEPTAKDCGNTRPKLTSLLQVLSLLFGIDVATGIVLFFIRFAIVITPVLILVILPAGLIALYFKRRARRVRLARALEASPISD